jgi:hypothetical protein
MSREIFLLPVTPYLGALGHSLELGAGVALDDKDVRLPAS